MQQTRDNAIAAYGVLDYIGCDLVAAAQAFRHFQSPQVRTALSQHGPACLNRVCLNHIFIALCRWLEFYDKFHQLLKGDQHANAKRLKKNLEARNLQLFRNEFLAHIWSRKHNRPFTDDEIHSMAHQVAGDDFEPFVAWVHDYNAPAGSETVVRLVESQRDFIYDTFNLTAEDVAPGLFELDA